MVLLLLLLVEFTAPQQLMRLVGNLGMPPQPSKKHGQGMRGQLIWNAQDGDGER